MEPDIKSHKKGGWNRIKRFLFIGGGLFVIVLVAFIYFVNPFSIPKQEKVTVPIYEDPQCSRVFTPQLNAGPYYQGLLYDTHFHFPPTFKYKQQGNFFPALEKEITIKEIVCELEKEKVVGVIAFYFPNFWQLDTQSGSKEEIFNQWIDEAKKIRKGIPEWIHLLFTPGPLNSEEVAEVYDQSIDVFEGFGEVVYFFPAAPRFFSKPDDKISLGIDKIANDKKQIIMLHPSQRQKNNLENALRQNPNAVFLLHGWEHDDYVWQLMEKYQNLYFSLDAATLYPIYGKIDGNEDKFIKAFTKTFREILDKDMAKWKLQIKNNPGRFMWGTDRYLDWHYSESTTLLFEEFARAFIGRLDPEVQEDFAYKNAQNMLLGIKNFEEIRLRYQNSSTRKGSQSKNLDEMSEQVRLCVIGKIGEGKWREISTTSRPLTAEEIQVIEECNR